MRKGLFLCLILLTVLACQTVLTTPTTDTTLSASATNTSRPILTAPIEPFVTLTPSSSATQDASTPTLSPTQAIPTSVIISASSTAIGSPTISTVESTEVTASVTVEPPSTTPTQIAGPITATYEATPLGGGECRGYPCYHSAEIDYIVVRLGGVNIRYGPGIEYAKAGFRVYGEVFHVGCLVQVNNNDWWAGTETCYGPNMANNTYTAVEVGGIEYTRAVIGPAGR